MFMFNQLVFGMFLDPQAVIRTLMQIIVKHGDYQTFGLVINATRQLAYHFNVLV